MNPSLVHHGEDVGVLLLAQAGEQVVLGQQPELRVRALEGSGDGAGHLGRPPRLLEEEGGLQQFHVAGRQDAPGREVVVLLRILGGPTYMMSALVWFRPLQGVIPSVVDWEPFDQPNRPNRIRSTSRKPMKLSPVMVETTLKRSIGSKSIWSVGRNHTRDYVENVNREIRATF